MSLLAWMKKNTAKTTNANTNQNSSGQTNTAGLPNVLISASQTQGSAHVRIDLSEATHAADSGELTLYLTIANVDAQLPLVPSVKSQGYVVDDSGTVYDPWMYGANHGGTLWGNSYIVDGDSKSGTLCFQVPLSKKNLKIILEYQYKYQSEQAVSEFSIR